jgi:membrane glycosyltransferase
VSAGVAAWSGSNGNYWGHNAIIRTRAFAQAAGLPHLPGRPPFGGSIQSHDFVEAALLRRARWDVQLAWQINGSFEGTPQSIAQHMVRDRRWAQGNLQHTRVLGTVGLSAVSRMHFLLGIGSYVVPMLWGMCIVSGILLALQAHALVPQYFGREMSLFPNWPRIDPVAALQLMSFTLAILLLPKLLGLLHSARRTRDWPSRRKLILGTLLETLLTTVIAPILIFSQIIAVTEIILGRDSGWRPAVRAAREATLHQHCRSLALHSAVGVSLAIACSMASTMLLVWMAPVIIGLIFAPLIAYFVDTVPARKFSAWLDT